MWPPPLLCTPQAMDMLPGARFCHRPPGSARLTLSPVTPRPSLLLRARVCGRGRSTGQLLGTGRALLTRLSSAHLGASSSQQRPHCHLQLPELCWTHPLQRVPLGHRHQCHSAWHPQPTSHSTWLSVPLPLRGEGQILPLQLARPGLAGGLLPQGTSEPSPAGSSNLCPSVPTAWHEAEPPDLSRKPVPWGLPIHPTQLSPRQAQGAQGPSLREVGPGHPVQSQVQSQPTSAS